LRPTVLEIDLNALLHNLKVIESHANGAKIIAMVKSNAYGCGLENIVKTLSGKVYAFGVACIAEANAIRGWGVLDRCVLFQGVHQAQEWEQAAQMGYEVVLHQHHQLQWLLEKPLPTPVRIWAKFNTGMNRLGFHLDAYESVIPSLIQCPWVDKELGLMTHFACADDPMHVLNLCQKNKWQQLSREWNGPMSVSNSAAIWSFNELSGSHVRPGLALYGVSPIEGHDSNALDLKPVMRFKSAIMAIHQLEIGESIGYGATFVTKRPSIIGVVAVGYGDGYPRHILPQAHVLIQSHHIPIVGRISMDMMMVDLTDYPGIRLGDPVELWGENLLIEEVARFTGTISYELMCQVCPRERLLNLYFKE
jgi:alanine racemase